MKTPVPKTLFFLLFPFALAASLSAQEPSPTPNPVKPVLDHPAQMFAKVWNYPVTTTQQQQIQSGGKIQTVQNVITVGHIVLAAAGLLIGLLVARQLARGFSRYARRRFALEDTRLDILQKILFALLITCVVFTVLNWLQIPLATFAFLGGALAIGIGFGTQTIMNNFISGIIVMAEQQIKIGDVIEVDGQKGKVTHLGVRCLTMVTSDGAELLVPNSRLVANNVLNWTLANPHRRLDFAVGLAYGTPVEKALAVLGKAFDGVPDILENKPREVLFEEFADSTLNFRLYYWLDVRSADNRIVGSAIRRNVDRLCRGAGLEIAFPQRDVHLHAREPLPVKIEGTAKNL